MIPPLQPQAQATQGPATKPVTPKQSGGTKVETAQTEQKTDNKKADTVPKLDINKSAPDKGKVTLNERAAATTAKTDIKALFTPEPNLNFYVNRAADIDSDDMVVDTEEEGETAKGKKRKAPPLRTDVPEEEEPEVDDTNNVVDDLLQSHCEVEDKNSAY